MVILSTVSSCRLFAITAPTSRAFPLSLPSLSTCCSSSSSSVMVFPVICSLAVVKSSSSKSRSPCLVSCASKFRRMAQIMENKKESVLPQIIASAEEENDSGHSSTFLNSCTEEELLSQITKDIEVGRLPLNVANGMEELYWNYRNAVLQSGVLNANETVLSNMTVVFDRISIDVKDPFVFSAYHKAIREPFDYYKFGQDYVRPLIDFRSSYVGNISLFDEIEEKLHQGENVVLISNHQTEADPAVISLLLEATHPYIAENIIYVAGDRVITDPLCKPFSMGRNLLCVYSKKHMYDVPELAEMKKRSNTRTLKEMAQLFRGGSKLIWIAPSGGRDRPDPVTNVFHPAPFDTASVDNMRRLVEHAGACGHLYPLAILCFDIMPPPLQVETEIGEERVMSFHGVGLSVAPKINFLEVALTCGDSEQAREAHKQALFDSVSQQYNVLNNAINGKQGLKASTPIVNLSQPWF